MTETAPHRSEGMTTALRHLALKGVTCASCQQAVWTRDLHSRKLTGFCMTLHMATWEHDSEQAIGDCSRFQPQPSA